MRKTLLRVAQSAYPFITGKGTTIVLALFFAYLATIGLFIFIYAQRTHAAVNSTINFQARILQSNGAVVADGSYNVQFKIYDASTGGSNEWTETQTLPAKNGYITASLGSITSFSGAIDWSQEHWLTMNVNGDGEMGPTRMKITAVPYSFRSGQADALTNGSGTITAAGLLQLSPSSIQATNSSNSALRVNQQGTGALLQLQSAGTDRFTISNAGDVSTTGGLTVGNSTSTTAGTIRWNGTAFEGYNGSAWTSLGGGLVLSSGSTASFVSGLANIAGTVTGSNAEMLVFTSATGVSNTAGVTGFTAPAAGSFRTCLVKNNAAITAGTLSLRWRVNGASVGASACGMSAAVSRQSATSLDAGVVTFNAGDTIGVAFDTSGMIPAATNDFTVYWTVEYSSSSSSLTLQKVYDSSSAPVTVTTTNNKDINFTLSDTATDSNFIVNIASGSTGRFAVQNNGTDVFSVNTVGATTSGLSVTGQATIGGNLIASGAATGTNTTASGGSQTNVTTISLTSGVFADNDVIFINNAGQDYYTRVVTGGGTSSITVSPAISYDAGATITKYNVQNIGATSSDYATQSNRFFQGYFLGGVVIGAGSTTVSDGNIESTTALTLQKGGGSVSLGGALNVIGTISGNGSGITNIDASQISGGTLADNKLSTNVTLLGNTFNGNNQLVKLDGSGALPALNASALTNLSASSLSGALPAISGAALTSLDASNISSGTISDSRLTTNVTIKGNTFNGANQLVLLDSSGYLPSLNASALTNLTSSNLSGALPAISGAALTSLNASNISSGTVDDARLSTNVTLLGNTFNGNNQLVKLDGSGALPALNASALTSLNGNNISSGTVADSRLTTNVTIKGNTFNGASQLVLLDSSGNLPALNGSALTSLSAGNLNGALPAISGAALTSLSASNISSGTLADARLSSNVTLLGNTFNGASQLVRLDASGYLPALNGSALTTLNASNVGSGILADGRLSTNVAFLNTTQAFSAQQSFTANIIVGTDTASPTAGLISFNDATGSNGFTAVLGASSLTASRSINLPDEAGTLCIRSSSNCGFVLMSPGSAQADGTNNSSIIINKTSSTGDLLTLQRGGTTKMQVLNSGALQLQLDATNAFTVKNATGTEFFNVDTSGALVRVGAASDDGNATLLVLDSKNTTGDPTGTNGGSYYNSADNKSRCYEDGYWTDCITNAIVGESTLASANATINVSLAKAYESLECRVESKGRSLAGTINLRFNNVSAAATYNWTTYYINNAAVADAQSTSDTEIQLSSTITATTPFSADVKITNFSNTNKAVDWTGVGVMAIGTNMHRFSGGGMMNLSTGSITSVQFISSSGTFNAGSHAWCQGRNIR